MNGRPLRSGVALAAIAALLAAGAARAEDPAAAPPRPALRDFQAEVLRFRQMLVDHKLTLEHGTEDLDRIYKNFFLASPTDFDLVKLRANALPTLRDLFATRLLLREQLRSVIETAPSPHDPELERVIASARNVLRAARFAEDFIVEWGMPKAARAPRQSSIETSPAPFLLLRDGDSTLTLRDGDVFVQRSPSSVSAGVARIASIASQFSHAGLIYVGPDKEHPDQQKRYVVDVQMQDGLRYRPIRSMLDGTPVRVAFYRLDDAALSRCAADRAYADAVKAGHGMERVFYDIPNDMDQHDKLFCAELIRAKCADCSHGTMDVPLYPSHFGKSNRSLLDAMGITAEVTFEPGDLEVDPRFVQIAEWRDPRKLRIARYHDAILTKIFEWMDQDGYAFFPGRTWRFTTNRIWNMQVHADRSGFPGSLVTGPIRRLVRSKVAMDIHHDGSGMSREGLSAVLQLNAFTGRMVKELETVERKRRKKTGVPMTYRELLGAVEQIRATRLDGYRAFRRVTADAHASLGPGARGGERDREE